MSDVLSAPLMPDTHKIANDRKDQPENPVQDDESERDNVTGLTGPVPLSEACRVVSEGISVKVESAAPVTPETPKLELIKGSTEKEAKDASQLPALPVTAPPKGNVSQVTSLNFRPTNRGRVVSLDRLQDGFDMDGYHSSDTNPVTEGERRYQERKHEKTEDDDDSLGADSSDGESSYFAKHLPSPKSRRFSYSSTGSAPNMATAITHLYQSNKGRESDASLSFSDESDDEEHLHNSSSSVPLASDVMRARTVADMQPYPHGITRMHSVSSLVSSASEDNKKTRSTGGISHSGSAGSLSSTGTSSDPSVRAELRDVVGGSDVGRASSRQSDRPSGRRKPDIAAQTSTLNNSFASYKSQPQPSPPPIVPGYTDSSLPHPQPQSMTPEQLSAWVSAGNMQHFYFPTQQPESQYGSIVSPPSPGVRAGSMPSESSMGTLQMVYSEDDDTDEGAVAHAPINFLSGTSAGRPTSGGGQGAWNNGVRDPSGDPQDDGSGRGTSFGGPRQAPRAGNAVKTTENQNDSNGDDKAAGHSGDFKVYWQRWIMLMYMSVLNLLSDWTCYSVAPISVLTQETFGNINPEQLVVVFLGANAIASACEPIILARLGLRRTVLFGALLLMFGSLIKSGGSMPPLIVADVPNGQGAWKVYIGFFLVGLSQPLYQCTPALLSASWFPERERTMATGVALNANQLGIGFAFIFGTLLVAESDDIPGYFGLLSLISTLAFMGTLIQFDDAPPTPPSDTARVMRGSLEVSLPSVNAIFQSVRSLGGLGLERSPGSVNDKNPSSHQKPSSSSSSKKKSGSSANRKEGSSRKSSRSSSSRKAGKSGSPPQLVRSSSGGSNGSGTRRRPQASSRAQTATADSGFRAGFPGAAAPSPARSGRVSDVIQQMAAIEAEAAALGVIPPSPMMSGNVGQPAPSAQRAEGEEYENPGEEGQQGEHMASVAGYPPLGRPGPQQMPYPGPHFNPYSYQHPQYQYPYWDPQMQQHFQQQMYYQQQQGYQQQGFPPQGYPPQGYYIYQPPPQGAYYFPPQQALYDQAHDMGQAALPTPDEIDEGAEPTITFTPHHLDIDIRDDQVLLSTRACLSRPGFIHALVAFTVSGIVINTLSTYMDYLVRLNGVGREYVGIVGGSFQFVIMISSLIVGKQTDKTRAYYSVTVGMLVLGAFGLAECGVSLDADRGKDLRWSLVIVAALVGPLQPVSTELGVDVAYPLSENTVLVIQQLFSNLLSATFIPIFKALKDIGTEPADNAAELYERPEYTFSFYLLIVLHAGATVFFATFNGRYLRYEHELEKKAAEEERRAAAESATAFHPVHENQYHPQADQFDGQVTDYDPERQPLTHRVI